ncbi:MAG: pentapeptide repeat-containing protein [Christensenellaceae bacterium]
MNKLHHHHSYQNILKTLAIDCAQCSGLCCTALYFAKSEGFPADKPAGKPCSHLLPDFRCAVHDDLIPRKLKGCLTYDCFGAGQKTTQGADALKNWKTHPEIAPQLFRVFLLITRFHQMLWYLIEAASLTDDRYLRATIDALIHENETITALFPEALLAFDIDAYQTRVNAVLKKVSQHVAVLFKHPKHKKPPIDCIGKNLKKSNQSGQDFSMCLLISTDLSGANLYGTNFLGADLRDTRLHDTDLSESLFLTQGQINAAKGNAHTCLPEMLKRPFTWV